MKSILSFALLFATLHSIHSASAQATMAALNQNAVWAGIENPIEVTSVHPFDDVQVSGAERLNFEMKGTQHASFSVVPQAGAQSMSLSIRQGSSTPQAAAVFRILPLPAPEVQFGTFESGGSVSEDALEFSELSAVIPGVSDSVPMVWTGFHLSIMEEKDLDHFHSDTQALTPEMRKALKRAKKGANIFFSNITIETPDGATHIPENILLFKQ